MNSKRSICILPDYQGLGGPASFQARLIKGMYSRGVETHHDPSREDTAAILVIAGTRHLRQLRQAKKRGIRIIQRLNGMNWTHHKVHTGLKHYVRAETYNWLLSTIRQSLADTVIYQSDFTRQWWTNVYGETGKEQTVIYNGVDLNEFSPSKTVLPPTDRTRILVIEGHLSGGHEFGFSNVIRFCKLFASQTKFPLELQVVGDVPPSLKHSLQAEDWINWTGMVKIEHIPNIIHASHLYMPCEINAACPNSLLEALACGAPVIGFDTGAILELVGSMAGKIVPYGASAADLEPADAAALLSPTRHILANLKQYQSAARARAVELFDVEKMVDRYLQVLLPF